MARTPYDHQREKRNPPHVGLADLRAALGLTQQQLADRVAPHLKSQSFTKGALSAIELGHRGASPETLAALEAALGLAPGKLRVDYSPTHNRLGVPA